MPSRTNIFITGVTGYIGGTVLQRLLHHPSSDNFHITAFLRSEDKASKLTAFGVKTIIGSLDDFNKLAQLSADADVVIHTASADHLEYAKAILRGIKERFVKTGVAPILIHTSGTGVFMDDARGEYGQDHIYYDTNIQDMESLPATAPHRNVDIEVTEADKLGYVRTFIILPSTIYGIASGPLVDLGIQNPYSIQVPYTIRASLARGSAAVVGQGLNVWNNVHIDEVGDLYRVVFDSALKDLNTPHGRQGYYFAENGEYSQVELAREIGRVMHELGMAKSQAPTKLSDEENMKYLGGWLFGTNARTKGEMGRSLGWKPVKTSRDFFASIRQEVEALSPSSKTTN
ncbi:hypothetical protein HETIRDRAFT_380746 [Heterobasidion irregulare TC 32-1]|uniref:NmrA-like domain-containing protein n=1 Tax=Heterobasidion irregulare (strain TC 32-1) TaxID=747525 RepID=W4KCP2_HETIT|nr:uncharacterized protein HETIRDRAFT_380746 [Heterobasidion irregulare TC 32-1]ETW83553.1 hypothetical protein HETIRDRAFT_380746 [Heterobasidion irregulare TC 32-1]